MTHLTLDQITGAIAEMPRFDKERLFNRLLGQLRTEHQQIAITTDQMNTVQFPDPQPNEDWLNSHRDEYRGQWVALFNGKLIAHGNDSRVLAKTVEESGAPIPLILYVEPATSISFFVGWY